MLTLTATPIPRTLQLAFTGLRDLSVIEIGGQDAKYIRAEAGGIVDFTMNRICAAGTGSFLEEQAERLGIRIKGEFSEHAFESQQPQDLGTRCTVFMERDLNHYLNEGFDVNEVLASVLHAIRENYLTKVAIENNIGKTILFQGATAKNKALVAAFEQKLNKPIVSLSI